MSGIGRQRRQALTVISFAAVLMSAGAAFAGPFDAFGGSWSGSGNVRLEGGRSEGLKCKAYYTPQGGTMGLALRCASSSNKIELRAKLTSNGNQVSGSWEERTYNLAGNAAGQAAGNTIRLAINGGGLAASMSVITSGGTQTISVRTDGSELKGVNITLRRD